MSKEHVIAFVLEIYQNNRQTREYLNYLLDPNEKEILEKFKSIITEEFYPKKNMLKPKLQFSVCERAIEELISLNPYPELLVDVMLTLPEMGTEYSYQFGDMWEEYYEITAVNFNMALYYMEKHDLLGTFKERCRKCMDHASQCGSRYGFDEEMSNLYYQYYRC